MRRIILTICIALATLSASAQTVSNNYGDLRAKVLHVGQKLTVSTQIKKILLPFAML